MHLVHYDPMFTEGEELPIYLPLDDPLVLRAARAWTENAIVLESHRQLGCTRILIGQDPESGDYILLRNEERENMEKQVFWGIRNAKEKLKSVYMDMEEMPEHQKEIRVMVKRLDEIEKAVDEAVN